MDTITRAELNVKFDDLLMQIDDGAVFIHPTDTIYGIGCDATNKEAVRKIRDIKGSKQPFSIIVPGKKWIEENCILHEHAKEYLEKLPGPYTLIFKLKNKDCIAPNVNFDFDTIGVRIPDHWFTETIGKIGNPCITTSANRSGGDFMTGEENLHPDVEKEIDFMIYEREKKGTPSTIIDLSYADAIVQLR